MKESYGEGLATHTDPESCGATCEGGVEALTGARAGWVLSRETTFLRDADAVDPEHVRKHLAREPGGPVLTRGGWNCGTRREVQGRTPTMNGHGKSDRPGVPMKSPNNAGQPVAEGTEGKGLAKGNLQQQTAPRTLSRQGAPSALERVRQAASRDRKMRFTALLHHIYDLKTLRAAYLGLKRDAAAGVDGETWQHYGEQLEENLRNAFR